MSINKITYLARHANKLPQFISQYFQFKAGISDWKCDFKDILPILDEKTSLMQFDAHYVYHTGWAARILKELSPDLHVDISSSIMFCAIASAHTHIKHYDYRKPTLTLPNVECGIADLSKLSFADDTIHSLSCMHVIEHIGLGRYGDPINPIGDLVAAHELKRVLAPGGHLILVVPLAEKAVIRFNGHRIYNLDRIKRMFDDLELIEFSFLNEAKSNKFTRHASLSDTFGSKYGCGCFLFHKPEKN